MKKAKLLLPLLYIAMLASCTQAGVEKTTAASVETTQTTTSAATTTAASVSEETEKVESHSAVETSVATNAEDEAEVTTNDENPLGELVVNTDVEASLQEALDNTTNIFKGENYTASVTYHTTMTGTPVDMSTIWAHSADLGDYMDMDMLFMKMKQISHSDGTVTMILDDTQQFVNTTAEESGMTLSSNPDNAILPIKEDVTSADLVKLPNSNKNLYRFKVAADNMESGTAEGDSYFYVDADLMLLTNIYTMQNGAHMTADFLLTDTIDESLFTPPADYTELSYEDYTKQLQESFSFTDETSEGEE